MVKVYSIYKNIKKRGIIMFKNKIREITCRLVKSRAEKAAVKNANSTCEWWFYQPEQPKSVKKLRKF